MQPTPVTHTIQTVGIYMALAHNIVLYTAVLYKNKKMEREISNSTISTKVHAAQLITLFLFILFNLGSAFMIQPFTLFISCQASVDTSIITFAISRLGVWLFGLYRIHIAFHSKVVSSLGYKKRTLLCAVSTSIIVCLFFTVTSLMVTKGVMIPYDETNPSEGEFCAYSVSNTAVSFLNMLLDQCAPCAIFVLFYRKMKAIRAISTDIQHKADDKIIYVMHKYTVLMGTNFLSTLIMTVAIVFFNPIASFFSAIDSIINMWTILLFDARYNAQYRQMFACCLAEKVTDQLAKAMNPSKNRVPTETSKPSDGVPSKALTVTVDAQPADSSASTPIEASHPSTGSKTIKAKSELNTAIIHSA